MRDETQCCTSKLISDSGLKKLDLDLSATIGAVTVGVAVRFIELNPLKVELALHPLNFANIPLPSTGEFQDVSRGLTNRSQSRLRPMVIGRDADPCPWLKRLPHREIDAV